jgi:hypothetical protein
VDGSIRAGSSSALVVHHLLEVVQRERRYTNAKLHNSFLPVIITIIEKILQARGPVDTVFPQSLDLAK